ncbi:MAG: hypothetical protein CMP47_02060 [Rickettsiales bacterium]|nr:hypothetical protein [Rickettsiales bacterium]
MELSPISIISLFHKAKLLKINIIIKFLRLISENLIREWTILFLVLGFNTELIVMLRKVR